MEEVVKIVKIMSFLLGLEPKMNKNVLYEIPRLNQKEIMPRKNSPMLKKPRRRRYGC